MHTQQFKEAEKLEENKYDFSPSFEYISPYLQDADLAVANLETTFAGKEEGYSCFPLFNTPDEMAYNLKEAGFDLMSTANNHSLDMGTDDLYRTIDVLEDAELKSFGTSRSQQERNKPLVIDANGIDIGFLAYTDSTNGLPIPQGKEHIINYIDVSKDPNLENIQKTFEQDIQTAHENDADIIAVYMHWGEEYQFEPTQKQKDLARLLAEAEADIILGSHPHVIQPMEEIEIEKEDGSIHKAIVTYSMGNFISNQHYISGAIPTKEVKYGKTLQVDIKKEKGTNDAYIKDVFNSGLIEIGGTELSHYKKL